MPNKEEIENILNKCNSCKLKECIGCEMTCTERKQIKEYIEQLETDKQKLIEKLEEANELDTKTVKYYENAYRNATDEFYKKSYKRQVDTANARRETRKSILEILKGEKE